MGTRVQTATLSTDNIQIGTTTTTEKTTEASSDNIVIIPNVHTSGEADLRNSQENPDVLKSSKFNTESASIGVKKVNEQTSIHNLERQYEYEF
uniref:Uncharacterized protein n=1 Tax=Heterorhabditis bacteriophora TaxID=37862 RepID=A0A1I7WRN8_HETBA